MAPVATFVISIRDAKRRRGKVIFHIDLSPTGGFGGFNGVLEDAIEYLQEIAKRINQVITGSILRLTLNVDLALPDGMRTVPEPESDIEEGGAFVYEGKSVYFRNVIPTFNHELFPAGTSRLTAWYGDADLESLVLLLVQSTDAPDWPAEYGGITDNRGKHIHLVLPTIQKAFKESQRD